MWGGVTRGLAGIKLSGSPRMLGQNRVMEARGIRSIINPKRSL